MTEPVSRIKIGLFMVVGVALVLASIIMFSGNHNFFHSYSIFKIHFQSIQGLAKGSVVSISGMDVGDVRKITFGDDSSMVVSVEILSAAAKRLTKSSIASIRTQGALGDKYIYINPGRAGETALASGSVIPSQNENDFIDMLTNGKGPDLSIALHTLQEFNDLLNALNSNDRLAALVDNLSTATTNISNASSNISKLADEPDLRESFWHLKNILKKIDDGDGTLGRLINDPTLHDRLISILGDEPRNRYLKPLLREAIRQNEENQNGH